MENLHELIKAHREAGDVKRMHTVPVVTDPSVARHSWNMAILLWLLHPKPTFEMIMKALTHDNAERWIGDTPSPAKYRINPGIKEELDAAEYEINKVIGCTFELTEDEAKWVRAVDLLEFLMYCEDELAMGNQNVKTSLTNVRAHIAESDWIPPKIKIFARDYMWSRTFDTIEGEKFGALNDHT